MSEQEKDRVPRLKQELASIYSDLMIWMFIATGIGAGIAAGSTLYGLFITGGLSGVYLYLEKHHA